MSSSACTTIAAKDFAFDHLRSFPSDNRFKLRELLLTAAVASYPSIDDDAHSPSASLDLAQVRYYLKNQRKTFSYAYLFPYPYIAHKRKGQKPKCFHIFPLSRILALEETTSLDLVQSVCQAHPSAIRAVDEEGRLPLHYACRFGHCRPILEFLVHQFPEAVSVPTTTDGVLPFHYLCSNQGHGLETVQWMLQLYPQALQSLTKAKWTPLHYATLYRHDDDAVALFLLQSYPDASRQTNAGGNLPLHIATASDRHVNQVVIEALLQVYPQSVQIPNGGLFYPLHSFLASEAPEKPMALLETLVTSYPEAIRCKTRNKKTPLALQIACKRHASVTVFQRLLQEYPEAVRQENLAGKTTRQLAKEFGLNSSVQQFLERVDENLEELQTLSLDERRRVLVDLAQQASSTSTSSTVQAPKPESKTKSQPATKETVQLSHALDTVEYQNIKADCSSESVPVASRETGTTTVGQMLLREEKLAAKNLPHPVQQILRADSESLAHNNTTTSERSRATSEHSIRDQKRAVEDLPDALANILRSTSDATHLHDEDRSRSIVFEPLDTGQREASLPGAFPMDGPSQSHRSSSKSSRSSSDADNEMDHIVAAVVAQEVAELHSEVESLRRQLAERQQHSSGSRDATRDIPVATHAQLIETRHPCCNIL